MITLKDLEVGYWINVNMGDSKEHYSQVIEKDLVKQTVSLRTDTKDTISLHEVDFKEGLRGIPISEEILPKCNFLRNSNDGSFIKYKGKEEIIVEYWGDQGWGLKINNPLLSIDNKPISYLYYLHELQNLYNELTEENLILNL